MKLPSQRLGRGLSSLMGEVQSRGLEGTIEQVELGRLAPNPYQPRSSIDPAELAALTDSIRSNGLLQPLLVRRDPASPGLFQIIAGERRWRAAKDAGLTAVPCLIRELDDQASAAAALVENLQRSDLNPLDEAEGYQRLISSFAQTQEQVASSVGKSRSHVANTLRLLGLPEIVAGHVRNGLLSAGHARAALACADPVAAAAQIIADGLSVRQAEDLRDRPLMRDQPKPRQTASHDPDRSAVEQQLAEFLGMRVSITGSGQAGKLTIHYSKLEQLDYIIARLERT